ncbi:MAG TPA: endopeptidase La [Chloroflexota bacterium]|nr:endopeptidase La [Chloroflexota bacterium]
MDTVQTKLTLPVVALHDTVVFPGMVLPLRIGRPASVKAVETAYPHGGKVLLVAERERTENVDPDKLHRVGSVGQIAQLIRLPDGTYQALVQGVSRARVLDYWRDGELLRAEVEAVPEPHVERTVEVEALMRTVVNQIARYAELSQNIPEGAAEAARQLEDPGRLADAVAFSPDMTFQQRQELIEILDPLARLRWVTEFLAKQLEILEVGQKIQGEVRKAAEQNQREFFLREQMKAIQKELGQREGQEQIGDELRKKIDEAGMPDDVKERALREVERLETLPAASPEVAVVRNYVDWLVAMPWSKRSEESLDVHEAKRVLDEDHFGLQKVKERILEFLAVRKMMAEKSQKLRSPILLLVGPPGVGKTSLGRSLARAMGRKYARISLGGVHDEAEIRGHRRTYVGALPGRIVQALKTAGTKNPVFVLDEIDKVGRDYRGDPTAALLEVLDPEQNATFSDHYLEVPFDLSEVVFVTTANQLDTIPGPLRDRMEVIELPGYTEQEKVEIARRHLLPKQREAHGLTAEQLRIPDKTLLALIRDYTREAGVRNLEREIASLCRKAARRLAEGKVRSVLIRPKDLDRLLGPARYEFGVAETQDEVGIATGVAWTPVGGDVLTVEVNVTPGKGELILTGQLGDVMQESVKAALSYARSKAAQLGIDPSVFERSAIHVHVPAGAVPKDGPSAGITMATALVSALTNRPVRRDVAMTGEITLRGRVLPIGGLKEKMLAAQRAGITTFILPRKNVKDLRDVSPQVLKRLTVVPVEHADKVLETALLPPGYPLTGPVQLQQVA